jgi:hypothetical protein
MNQRTKQMLMQMHCNGWKKLRHLEWVTWIIMTISTSLVMDFSALPQVR